MIKKILRAILPLPLKPLAPVLDDAVEQVAEKEGKKLLKGVGRKIGKLF